MGSEPQGFATCRSCGQSTEGFSGFGCHTQVVGAEHTLYKTALSFLWMSWISSTLLFFYTVYSPLRIIYYLTCYSSSAAMYTLLPYTLAPPGLWISVIESQNLHCRRNLKRCGGTSTITKHHIAEHGRQERARGALHAKRNRATPHHCCGAFNASSRYRVLSRTSPLIASSAPVAVFSHRIVTASSQGRV